MTDPHPALPCPIAPYVPQTQGMCLLDRIVAVDDDGLEAEVMPTPANVFATAGGVPGWVGLEWLAQAVAAWAGWQAAARSEPPAVGFLVGARRFETDIESFTMHRTYRIAVQLEFRADNGLGHFHGSIACDGTHLAEGSLTVYRPTTDSARTLDQ